MGKTERIIKSKKRIQDFAEVYTPMKIVGDMCDLIPDDVWENINANFLEPTCGNGNFLEEIFRRKLRYCKNAEDGLAALSTIYGIDILPDNVEESKQRLFDMFVNAFPKASALTGLQAAEILEKRIICGNSLEIMETPESMSKAFGVDVEFCGEYKIRKEEKT